MMLTASNPPVVLQSGQAQHGLRPLPQLVTRQYPRGGGLRQRSRDIRQRGQPRDRVEELRGHSAGGGSFAEFPEEKLNFYC